VLVGVCFRVDLGLRGILGVKMLAVAKHYRECLLHRYWAT